MEFCQYEKVGTLKAVLSEFVDADTDEPNGFRDCVTYANKSLTFVKQFFAYTERVYYLNQ